MADWKKIKAEYLRGNTSYRKLAEKHGVSFSALRKRAASEKWTDLRNKKAQKRDTKIVESIACQEAKKAVDLADIAELLANKIREGVEDGTFIHDANSTRAITAALRDLKELSGPKLQRDAEEQLARIEKLRKEAREEDENSEIRVVIDDGLAEYGG